MKHIFGTKKSSVMFTTIVVAGVVIISFQLSASDKGFELENHQSDIVHLMGETQIMGFST